MRYPKIRNNVTTILSILSSEGPKTRQELVDRVRPAGTTRNWGTDLFAKEVPAFYSQSHVRDDGSIFSWKVSCSRGRASLKLRGMIEVVGKRGRSELWSLTPYGYEVLMNKVLAG